MTPDRLFDCGFRRGFIAGALYGGVLAYAAIDRRELSLAAAFAVGVTLYWLAIAVRRPKRTSDDNNL